MKLRRLSLKELMVVIFSGVVALGIMNICNRKVWEYVDPDDYYNSIIVSSTGEEYEFWGYDYYIVGLKKGKKAGTLLPRWNGGNETLYYIKGADSDRYITTKNPAKRPKMTIDPWRDFGIYVKVDEGFGYDYRDPNVSGVVFIPDGYYPWGTSDFDYLSYLEKNGIFGEEAKAIMVATLTERTDDEVFSDELKYLSNLMRFSEESKYIGELIYAPEGVDWFAYLSMVYYNPDYGYFICIPRFSTSDAYLLTDENAKALGIG